MPLNWSEDATPVVVSVPTQKALVAALSHCLRAGKGFSVATLNLDHVVKLHRNAAFRKAYTAQTHVTADGNPVVWLCRMAGQRDVRLTPGSDAILPLVQEAHAQGLSIALFGSTQASLDAAAEALERLFAGLSIALRLSPPMNFDPESPEADAAIAQIRDSGARVVFLALGAPKQEQFAARAQRVLPHVGFLSIGAGLDFISGRQVRAPMWMRRFAVEWVWRLVHNPRRLMKRYALCALAMPRLTWRAASERFQV